MRPRWTSWKTASRQVTTEAIAERAGASKATVYRWWPNKAQLAIEAFREAVAPELPLRDTGSLRNDLTTQMQNFARVLSGRGRRRWIERLNMMQWIGHTKIDFMAWFPACATFSVVITVLGLVIAVVRGQGLFDIDFTGGVSVQTAFQKEQKIKDIRNQLTIKELAKVFPALSPEEREKLFPDVTVSNAHNRDEPDNQRFTIDTSNSNKEVVETSLKEVFNKELVNLELTATPLAVEKPATKAEGKTPEKPAPPAAVKPAEKGATRPEDKPSEPPADKSPPKPAEKKPAGTKPAENKAKQSQLDLPPLSLVAMTGDDAAVLALADSPAVKTGAKPEAKADTKPEAKADTKPEAKAESKTQAKPEATPAAKVYSAAAESTSPQVFQAELKLASRVAKLVDGPDGNKVTQLVDQPVRYDEERLKKLVGQALKENRIPVDRVKIELTAPEGAKKSEPGS